MKTYLRKICLLTFIIALPLRHLWAQPELRSPTSISVGFLGHNQYYSLNVSHLLVRKESWNLGARLGLPGRNLRTDSSVFSRHGRSFSAGISLILGRATGHFDVEASLNVLQDFYLTQGNTDLIPVPGWVTMPGGFVGYRRQAREGGFFFRGGVFVGVLGNLEDPGAVSGIFNPTFELGYTIGNGYETEAFRRRRAERQARRAERKDNPFPQWSGSLYGGVQLGALYESGEFRLGGQGGGIFVEVNSRKVAPAFIGGLGLDLRISKLFGLAGNWDLAPRRIDLDWRFDSYSISPFADDYQDASVLNGRSVQNRIAILPKFYFGDRIQIRAFAGPYLVLNTELRGDGTQRVTRNGVSNDYSYSDRDLVALLRIQPTELAVGGGLELWTPLRGNQGFLLRVNAGQHVTRSFSPPDLRARWLAVQLGYSLNFSGKGPFKIDL
ncbi:MAG: hypothetical protein AAGN35_06625 [Bacteroidota bacterium]